MLTNEDKYLLKLTKKIYPESFKEDQSTFEGGRAFKYKSLQHSIIIHQPKGKNLFAKFCCRNIYYEKFKDVRLPKQKEYVNTFEVKPYIDLPVLTVVRRKVISKGAKDVIDGCINVFRANVLIAEYFRYSDFERPQLKTLFRAHGIALLYEDEI
jgi:hypothetical protein